MPHADPGAELRFPRSQRRMVRGQVTPDGLRNFFDTSFSTLAETLATQGISITGPAFGLYRDSSDDVVDLRDRLPRRRRGPVRWRRHAKFLPAGHVTALAGDRGNFDGLEASWRQHQGVAEQAGT